MNKTETGATGGQSVTHGYIQKADTAEKRWMGETRTHFLATGDQTAGAFCLVDETARRGESVPMHRHSADMESFFVIEGEMSFFIGDKPGKRVGPGSFAHVPGGIAHGYRIESETARYLLLTTPRHGAFYKAITLPSREGGLAPLGTVDDAMLEQACIDFGVEIIGPIPD